MKSIPAFVCTAALAVGMSVGAAPVLNHSVLDYNFVNLTGTTANDFHFTLTFSSANGIGFTNPGPGNFVIPDTTGPFSSVLGSFSNVGRDFTVEMSGTTVQPGGGAAMHISIPVVGSPAFEVTSAYWTFGGDRIVPPRTSQDPDKQEIRRAFVLQRGPGVVPEPGGLSLLLLALTALAASRFAPALVRGRHMVRSASPATASG